MPFSVSTNKSFSTSIGGPKIGSLVDSYPHRKRKSTTIPDEVVDFFNYILYIVSTIHNNNGGPLWWTISELLYIGRQELTKTKSPSPQSTIVCGSWPALSKYLKVLWTCGLQLQTQGRLEVKCPPVCVFTLVDLVDPRQKSASGDALGVHNARLTRFFSCPDRKSCCLGMMLVWTKNDPEPVSDLGAGSIASVGSPRRMIEASLCMGKRIGEGLDTDAPRLAGLSCGEPVIMRPSKVDKYSHRR